MLEVRNLSVAYGGLRALQDVTLSVAERQFVTLVGPNGAGKSTTVKILTTLAKADAGTSAVAGLDLRAKASQVRRLIVA